MTERESTIYTINKIKEDLSSVKENVEKLLAEYDEKLKDVMGETYENIRKLADDLEEIVELFRRSSIRVRFGKISYDTVRIQFPLRVLRGIEIDVKADTTLSTAIELVKQKLVEEHAHNVSNIYYVMLDAIRELKLRYDTIINMRNEIERLKQRIERAEQEIAEIQDEL